MKKSVISLISYDAEYLPASIERYYNYVDEIVLGLDSDRLTWNNNKFSFDESTLYSQLSAIDGDNKIHIVEENFHGNNIAIQNDNYERNFLKNQCSYDWILSIDADEILLNAKDFFYRFCPLVSQYKQKVDICMTWVTPYKIIGDTTLLITNDDGSPFFGENQGVMTSNLNTYTYARWTNISAAGHNRILSPGILLHWSLARSDNALKQKITNTGHSDLISTDPFYSIWQSVTLDNYKTMKNFKTSGLGTAQWPALTAVPTNKLESYVMQYADKAY